MKKEQYILLGLAALAVIWFATRRTAAPEWYEQSPDPDDTQEQDEQQEEVIEDENVEAGQVVPNMKLYVSHYLGSNLESSNSRTLLGLVIPEGYNVSRIFGSPEIYPSMWSAGDCVAGYYPFTFNLPGAIIRSDIPGQLNTTMLQSGNFVGTENQFQYLMEEAPAGTIPLGNCTGDYFDFTGYLPAGAHDLLQIAVTGTAPVTGQIGFIVTTNEGLMFPMHFEWDGPGAFTSTTYINCQEL